MAHSLLVSCAVCGKLVVTKHKSKERCCSQACYLKLWRNNRKAKLEQASIEATKVIE